MPSKKKPKQISKHTKKEDYPWWKDAVIYQIYPRSFQDSNGDGIGDLQGIIDRLDYLNGSENSLGIDAIWLSPVNPSPMFDFGYDISDYENIDPIFGDLRTFKILLAECHKRNIKILTDLVVNHTSHLHPWFLDSRSSRLSKKRDWYIWKDGVKGKPPNNWKAAFGGDAWEWDDLTGQYYYHGFTVQQPDLNWRNPEVKEAIFKMIRFWLDLGVDGFRLDVVNYYFKDREYRSNPSSFFRGLRDYERQYHIFDRNLFETHAVLKEFRKILDSYKGHRMSVGEVFQEPPGTALLPAQYYGEKSDELHMSFNFSFLYCNWNPRKFAANIMEWEGTLRNGDWPNYTLSNHDQMRHISKYGSGKNEVPRAKICATMLLTLRGTPFLYYGEEIGMRSDWIPKKYIQDPLGSRYWPLFVGRDRSRQPMCWDNSTNAGFSSVEPWLPVSKNLNENNVDTQSNDSNSLLSVYKKLIKLRRKEITLRRGEIQILFKEQERVLVYLRTYSNDRILVILNFTDSERRFYPGKEPIHPNRGKVLFSTHRPEDAEIDLNIISVHGYEGLVIRLG
ncbi:MAG: alpha-glucosidase [Leptospiraceae bacterium]|nr:alpha-glucosidase [Leptospiraceae bacterium]